jgi:ubiquinone/menaquinone biosynthesis C-methylase UbiE
VNQKSEFLSGEGDKWYERNSSQLSKKWHSDIVFLRKYLSNQNINKFLEIGSSAGYKTLQLAKSLKAAAWGIDPSENAINHANLLARQCSSLDSSLPIANFSVGTADELKFDNSYFDFIYFGFCLYLVDPLLIPKVITEADRCLKSSKNHSIGGGGFLAILDFDPIAAYKVLYKHKEGLYSFKDDYTRYFLDLKYKIIAKENYIENDVGYSNEIDNRISITLLQKP